MDAPEEDPWLADLKRLAALAATGIHYAREDPRAVHDLERYEDLRECVASMLARLAGGAPERVADLLPDAARGYATPLVDVRGALLDGDRVLLVRERGDGLWTLPGGFADAGRGPAANVEREFFEEAGIAVRATRLYAVVHKASHGYDADLREFYKLYFLVERTDGAEPRPDGVETDAAAFHALDALPPLSTGRVIAEHVRLASIAARDPALPVRFD